jgi:Bacterial Ig domain
MYTHKKLSLAVLYALSAGLLAACGSGGYDRPPTPPAQAPTIAGLTDQSLPQDTTTPVLSFQVNDTDSGAGSVTVTATSSDTAIIPAEGIVLGGSGASRTLQITPAPEMIGDATITIRATDPDGLAAQQAIRVTVNGVFVSFTTTVSDAFAVGENGDQHSLSGFTFTLDADDDPTAFDVLLQ